MKFLRCDGAISTRRTRRCGSSGRSRKPSTASTRTKDPKTGRGTRTIQIDGDLIALLLAEREKHLRVATGVPDGAAVDLSLVKLPEGALMFPSPVGEARRLPPPARRAGRHPAQGC